EKIEEDEADDAKAQELMKRFTVSSQTRVSSFNFRPSAPKSERGDAGTSVIGKKEYKEPWDYYKYCPTTLPVRRPYSGNPELLNELEFKDDSETNPYNESSTKPADELGLMDEDLEKKLIFFQVPKTMPLPKPPLKDAAGSSITKACNFNELPTSFMGKMLVYKNGAVKLKVGDHLYNVSGGLDCSFAQDVVAMNTEEKHCCNIGEVNKRAIIAPDINSILDDLKAL
ncbi:DNA-directed RNA polymerase III subunit RPC4, partial [Tanacetum coccineum]